MPRTRKNYDKIVQRLAFLSLNGSEAAAKTAETIVWTLTHSGVNEETVSQIASDAETLADEGRDSEA